MKQYHVLFAITALFIIYSLREIESTKGFGSGEQEWGYVKVREKAHMFWWLYYVNPPVNSENFNVFTKPLIIWLQGGPGASSTGYGNFAELGPLDMDLQKRNYTWINDYNVLFIDNPVGAGFSYVESNSSYTKTNIQIAKDLVTCIKEFLEVVQGFKNTPTYIVGESYGGKMAAEFALLWYQAQNNGQMQSKLRGVALGDPWISPKDVILSWAPYLLYMGMIDKKEYEEIRELVDDVVQAVESENWTLGAYREGRVWRAVRNTLTDINIYNIFEKNDFPDQQKRLSALMNDEVQKALGLNVMWGGQKYELNRALTNDIYKPVTHTVERLLNETNLKVFVYCGQFDFIVTTVGTLAWVEKLKWLGTAKWYESSKYSIRMKNIVEGYVKEYGNLKLYWINRSGHMVPIDNPRATKMMLQDLTTEATEVVHQNLTTLL